MYTFYKRMPSRVSFQINKRSSIISDMSEDSYLDLDEIDELIKHNSLLLSRMRHKKKEVLPFDYNEIDSYYTSDYEDKNPERTRKTMSLSSFSNIFKNKNTSNFQNIPENNIFETIDEYDNSKDNHFKVFGNNNPVHIVTLNNKEQKQKKRKSFMKRVTSLFK